MCTAHLIRINRWQLFIKTYEKPHFKNLVSALSIGYLLNFFLPFKLGDVVRALIAGRRMKNGYGFSLATVIIDRCLDVIVVGAVFVILFFINPNKIAVSTSIMYIVAAVVIILAAALAWIYRRPVKKGIRFIASIFNETLEFKTMKFFWALIWGVVDIIKKISIAKLMLYTIGMWGLYIVSYVCFAKFLTMYSSTDINWINIFYILFAKNSIQIGNIKSLSENTMLLYSQANWLVLYLILPSMLILLLSLFAKDTIVTKDEKYLNLIPHLNMEERLDFLETYFSSEKSNYIQNYLKINQDILILRDYSAGSNATTMLCFDNNKNFFRKYAIGIESNKLYEQIEWLLKYKDILPLCEIIRYERNGEYCYYDMTYESNAVGMFEYAHSMPRKNAWSILQEVIQCLESTLYTVNLKRPNVITISKYIDSKVTSNIDKIMNAKYLKPLMEYEEIIINGKIYKNLPYYFLYMDKEHLLEIFKNDTCSAIHGDLTIENIICRRNAGVRDNWYIIDPNTGNVLDSPNLDYGKLLQSIHGGYEFLMATKNVEIDKNRINFTYTKSEAYTYLFKSLDEYMKQKFSHERVRSIYYHEIVHWLRLMPYKIEKNGKRVLLFYAGMLMVMNDVINRFER